MGIKGGTALFQWCLFPTSGLLLCHATFGQVSGCDVRMVAGRTKRSPGTDLPKCGGDVAGCARSRGLEGKADEMDGISQAMIKPSNQGVLYWNICDLDDLFYPRSIPTLRTMRSQVTGGFGDPLKEPRVKPCQTPQVTAGSHDSLGT